MKLQRKNSLCLVALFLLAGSATEAFASCVLVQQGPPCQEFWRADAVFIGKVTRVDRVHNDTQIFAGPYLRATTYLSVEEAFKGVEGTVVVFDQNDCPYLFKEGERYLVYAHYNSYTRKLDVRIGTTRTRPLSEAAEDLAYIRSLSSAPAGSRIFGRVFQQGFKESRIQVEPLPEVRVTLELNDERREVGTDSEGRYEFKNLSTGTYRIRAEGPAHLTYREQTIKTGERGCFPADIFALHKGQIAGRVLDTSGKPVRDVAISLVSADAKPERILAEGQDKFPGMLNYSDRDGKYWFAPLMPGRYLLIVNRDGFDTTGSDLVRSLPRLFYPGVHDIGSATVIVVDKDQKPKEYDLVLPIQQ